MQAHDFGLRHFDETHLLIRRNLFSGPSGYPRDSLLSVHASAHDRADNFAQVNSVAKTEWIGFAERLPDGGVARGRTLIGLDENILEEIDFSSHKR